MISFCCAVINRGEHFLRLYNSLFPSLERGHELVVADYGSDDIDLSKLRVSIVRQVLPFRRSVGLNAAANQARGNVLFFIDADMIVPENWDKVVLKCVTDSQAFFPICYSLREKRPMIVAEENGWWRRKGFGMCGFMRTDFERIGGWSEAFTKWGGEDCDIHRRAERAKLKIVRGRCQGLFHQWHPNDRLYKERYHSVRSQIPMVAVRPVAG